jgi:hypothetical protein
MRTKAITQVHSNNPVLGPEQRCQHAQTTSENANESLNGIRQYDQLDDEIERSCPVSRRASWRTRIPLVVSLAFVYRYTKTDQFVERGRQRYDFI